VAAPRRYSLSFVAPAFLKVRARAAELPCWLISGAAEALSRLASTGRIVMLTAGRQRDAEILV
jgi:hypothetical protein